MLNQFKDRFHRQVEIALKYAADEKPKEGKSVPSVFELQIGNLRDIADELFQYLASKLPPPELTLAHENPPVLPYDNITVVDISLEEGSVIALYGTNAKLIGHIDVYNWLKNVVYRNQVLKAPYRD